MRLRNLFWNPSQRRLRLPWRFPLQVVVLAVVELVVALVVFTAAAGLPAAATTSAGTLTAVLPVAVAAVVGVWVGSFVLDRRRFADYGFHVDRDWWVDLGFGLALGAVLMVLVFAVELAAGWVTVTGTFAAPGPGSFLGGFAGLLALFVVVGVYEELLLRGYLLRNLAEGLVWFDRVGPAVAVGAATVASSLVFGGLHWLNPNATVASTLGISVAGLFLASGYLLTGELAVPIGVHVTWNLFQGPVFGFPVSGTDSGVAVVALDQAGPALATGGAFGPEAGLLGVAASAVGVAAVVQWSRLRYGSAALHDGLTVPDLRWRSGTDHPDEPENPAAEAEPAADAGADPDAGE